MALFYVDELSMAEVAAALKVSEGAVKSYLHQGRAVFVAWLPAGRRCIRMSEFHDPELRQELGRLSGPYPDDNEAFAAWQRRVGQARRRRAVAWTTGCGAVADRRHASVSPRLDNPGGTHSCPSKSRRRPVPM